MGNVSLAGKSPGGDARNMPGDAAYIIYTSGSTGKPKGSIIDHRGLSHYVQWADSYYFRDKGLNWPEESFRRSCAHGAAAKVLGTDLGMQNCAMAIELMGSDGLRHDMGVEKLYRDAKLLQIYEGTNQLNRIEHYKKMIAPLAQKQGV